MPKQAADTDRNFDDLADRFDRNIYGRLKGQVRLAVLNRDFADFLPIAPYIPLTPDKKLNILDAGGGQGQFSLPLAVAGHSLTVRDLSQKMLAKAQQRASALGARSINFEQGSIQTLDASRQFELVLCHAVLEWLVEPLDVLQQLWGQVKAGGHLSLIFYNAHSLTYKNLLRANYKKLINKDYAPHRGSLTPINPLTPAEVLRVCEAMGAELLCHSGIRVFHDYILDPSLRDKEPEQALALELEYSRQPPFRDLGRYVHLLLRKPSG